MGMNLHFSTINRFVLGIVVLCVGLQGHAQAQGIGGPKELRKLASLGVVAAVLSCDAIDQKLIIQDVNTKLVVAGIKIDSEAATSSAHAIVGASLLCFPYHDSQQAFYIDLKIFRPVLIRTDDNMGPSTLPVWQQTRLVSCDPRACQNTVRSNLIYLTDALVADYQAGNPM